MVDLEQPSKEEEKKKQPEKKKKVLRVTHNEQRVKSHRLNMPLLEYVFSEAVERFYAHKSLSKFYVS
jgi:hypothetical protein